VPDLVLEPVRVHDVDGEQPVPVRPGARAATACLDAEQVVEHRHHEVVVQVALAAADAERHDGQPPGVRVAQQLDVGVGGPASQRPLPQPFLAGLDHVGADRLL
jgi:hypothetical protein